MPALLVHGVPDTERVWHAVLPRLGRAAVLAHDGPVDLVGHDWGALLVIRAACLRPDRVRTWTAGAAPLDDEYVWHKAAQAWQTPEVGEKVMAQLTPATLGRDILRLYRSAIKVGAEWGPELGKLSAPGLILWGELDPYAAPTWGERLAARTNTRFVTLPGCSHWWQLERPADVAVLLTKHWEAVGG
jgi:pimeloyl-ACP methyl ester carboxylesterase